MPVLTITSRKGGCGKTMLATVVAGSLAGQGVDVALLDTDPNAAVHRWASQTHTKKAIPAYAEPDAERLAELIPTLAERHAALVVDTAGFGNQASAVSIAAADLVLVPITPGEGDLVEAQRTVAFVGGLSRSTRRPIAVRVIANRIRRGTAISRHVMAELDTLGLPHLATAMSEAVAYAEIGFTGTLPAEGASAREIASLLTELREIGGIP
jgi:chromosome partitioning protein